jgi:hypothetical protein
VIRDKRGYETSYLMDWYRDGARQRSRILFVFRTPSGVRVGRESFTPEVMRQIEAQHPHVAFDWRAIAAEQQVIESAPEPRRRRVRTGEDIPAARPDRAEETVKPEPKVLPAPRPAIPSTIEGATPQEQIGYLNHWYPILRERIQLRSSDPARQEALFALAERLNPAAWTDAEEISTGLAQAAEALERLSLVFARRRRRARRRPAGEAEGAPSADGLSPQEPETASPDEGDGEPGEPPDWPEGPGDS